MRATWIAVGGMLLILGIAMFMFLGDRTPDTAASTPATVSEAVYSPGPIERGEMDPEPEFETEYTAPTEFARRLIHVPDTRPSADDAAPSTNERDITASNLESLLTANLERALEGEMASAYFAVRAWQACERFSRSPAELEKRIERTNKQVERDVKRGRELPARADKRVPFRITANPDINRSNLQDWFDACQRVRNTFTQDFREQLESQALAGNVMARYLYAVWPPGELDLGEAFVQQYHWEGLAREFSEANLESGEVAGLMAFGDSYRGGWFTSKNDDLAMAFTLSLIHI